MRLHRASSMPEPELLRRFERLATSLVSDVFGRWAGAPGLRPLAGLSTGGVVAGPALTVRTRPGDNLALHMALDLARPGEVIVVDAGGATDRAILGGLIGEYASTRSVAALVVDGAVRDLSDLSRLAPPVFARAVSHLGPYKDGPGEVRGSVQVAGVVVQEGDIVVGDEDGVAVVPRLRLADVLEAAESKAGAEAEEQRAIRAGTWDRTWIDRAITLVEVD